ncbi:protein smg8-like [Pollicipes pollicipes]|uniref:protein smg8-like n=1 Tax=Pollicipes pollicipes TaxID=41117 RepID=UPI001885102A|nr:protein smg8-like [Pollicipes pollicipes]
MKSNSFQFLLPSKEDGRWPADKVVVVALIGKSTDLAGGGKGHAFRNLLSHSVFGPQPELDLGEEQTRVEGFFCAQENVVYLHLRSTLDTSVLCRICRDLKNKIDENGFLTCWSELRYSAARALLFLFSVSHLLVLYHPSHVFDLSYIQMFLAIDACRQKLLRHVTDTLRSVPGVPSGWVNQGRPCPPRVLFYFASCPPAVARQKARAGRPASEQLQHSLEDQIYRLLRKVRVITNASAQSLFALPGNQPFVHVESAAPAGDGDPLLAHVRLLQRLCHQSADRMPRSLRADIGGVPLSAVLC